MAVTATIYNPRGSPVQTVTTNVPNTLESPNVQQGKGPPNHPHWINVTVTASQNTGPPSSAARGS